MKLYSFSLILTIMLIIEIHGLKTNSTVRLSDQIKNLWHCQQGADVSKHSKVFCPTVFDGWLCWRSIPVGENTTHPCPSIFMNQGNSHHAVTRRCLDGGVWEGFENDTFSNYSSCGFSEFMIGDQERLNDIVDMVESLPLSSNGEHAIEDAFEKCIRNALTQPLPTDKPYCRRTFDGWGCWNDTPAGEIAAIPCPSFIPGFVSTRKAHKVCGLDGTWFRHPDTNKTWSNYTTCVDQEDLLFRQYINALYIAGYSMSAVALLVSLIIFCYFKSLKCTRITIHKNLFVSFMINNVIWIVWYTEVVEHPSVLLKNEISCQILHVLVQYFMVTNYFWMFCEGLYLHTVLVVAFVSEETIMKGFYFIGWGIPLVLITVYTILRGASTEHTTFCWIQDSIYQWILSGPVCISLLLNLLFLINIVRVLVTKLRAVNSPDANQTKKAARATLILIPLLGLHYLLTPFRPEPKSSGEAIYETISAIVTSLQGLCVSFLFCFINGEVIAALRRKWNLTRLARSAGKRSCGVATSVSFLGRTPSDGDGKFCQETQVFSEV